MSYLTPTATDLNARFRSLFGYELDGDTYGDEPEGTTFEVSETDMQAILDRLETIAPLEVQVADLQLEVEELNYRLND